MRYSVQCSTPSSDGLARMQGAAQKHPKPTRIPRLSSVLAVALLAIFACASCSRVVLVTEASPIRIGPDCRTRIYTLHEGDWALGDNRVVIPEGWYVVPPSFVREEPLVAPLND